MPSLVTLAALAALLSSAPAFAGGVTVIVRQPDNVLIPAPPSSHDHLIIVGDTPIDTMVITDHSSSLCIVRGSKVRIGDTTVRRLVRRCH